MMGTTGEKKEDEEQKEEKSYPSPHPQKRCMFNKRKDIHDLRQKYFFSQKIILQKTIKKTEPKVF